MRISILDTLNNSFVEDYSELQDSTQIVENISDSSAQQDSIGESNTEVVVGRLKGKFVSPNFINLSTRILSKTEISLLFKDLKFVPTPASVNKALIKEENIGIFINLIRSLISIVKDCLSQVKNAGDIPNETLEYLFISKPKLRRFYLLPKIHKRPMMSQVELLFQIVDFLRRTFQLFWSIT